MLDTWARKNSLEAYSCAVQEASCHSGRMIAISRERYIAAGHSRLAPWVAVAQLAQARSPAEFQSECGTGARRRRPRLLHVYCCSMARDIAWVFGVQVLDALQPAISGRYSVFRLDIGWKTCIQGRRPIWRGSLGCRRRCRRVCGWSLAPGWVQRSCRHVGTGSRTEELLGGVTSRQRHLEITEDRITEDNTVSR